MSLRLMRPMKVSLSSMTGGEGEIRKNIIEDDLVECIIALPEKLFYTTGISVCLWFLDKDKKQKGKTLFINAKDMGKLVTRNLKELSDGSIDPEDNDIKVLADTYKSFVDGTFEAVPGFSAEVTTEQIKDNEYILTPGRYVGIGETEDDGEPFEDKMKRLTTELAQLFEDSNRLQVEIGEKLAALGYPLQ